VAAWNTTVSQALFGHRIDVAVTDADGNRIGPNLPMTADPVADPSAPSVAALTGGTVIAWSRITDTGTHIVLDTLDPSGQKLDGFGAPCDPGVPDCGVFQVTQNGNARSPFLARPIAAPHTASPTENQVGLTWIGSHDACLPTGPCANVADVFWKKIEANGVELVPDKQITASSGIYALPRLAFDGTHDGIVWRDDSPATHSDFYFATIDELGQISAAPTLVGSAGGSFVAFGSPDLVWDETDYALAAAGGGDSVLFERFATNGVSIAAPRGVTFGGVACTPALAWDGEHFALAWQTECNQPASDLAFELFDGQGVRIKPDGTSCGGSVDPTCGLLLLTHNAKQSAVDPEMVWAGGHSFGVVFTEVDASDAAGSQSDIYFQRIDCVP
jgi:hypothetical protein